MLRLYGESGWIIFLSSAHILHERVPFSTSAAEIPLMIIDLYDAVK